MKELVEPQIAERHNSEEDNRGVLLTTCWDPNEVFERRRQDERICDSLSVFAERVNSQGLTERIQRYVKPGVSLGEVFTLGTRFEMGWLIDKKSGTVFLDGYYSLILEFRRNERAKIPLRIAVLGFSFGPDIKYGTEKIDFEEKDPLMVQEQGVSKEAFLLEHDGRGNKRYNLKKYYEVRRVLRKFHWDLFLLDLFCQWAQENNFSTAYFLPHRLNDYFMKEPENDKERKRNQRIALRYKVFPKRMGFKKDTRGFWKKDLVGQKES